MLRDSDTSNSDSGEPADGARKARSDHHSNNHLEEKSSVVEEDANSDDGRLGWNWDKETKEDKAFLVVYGVDTKPWL